MSKKIKRLCVFDKPGHAKFTVFEDDLIRLEKENKELKQENKKLKIEIEQLNHDNECYLNNEIRHSHYIDDTEREIKDYEKKIKVLEMVLELSCTFYDDLIDRNWHDWDRYRRLIKQAEEEIKNEHNI